MKKFDAPVMDIQRLDLDGIISTSSCQIQKLSKTTRMPPGCGRWQCLTEGNLEWKEILTIYGEERKLNHLWLKYLLLQILQRHTIM